MKLATTVTISLLNVTCKLYKNTGINHKTENAEMP